MFVTSFCVSWRNSARSSCDLKVSGISNNLGEIFGTVFLSLTCCTSMTLSEFSGGSLFSMCFSFFRVRSHARVRARARWMDRCVSTREYKFVCVYGACLRLLVHTCGRWCLRACLGTLWCVLVFVYLFVKACTFVRVLSRADQFDAHCSCFHKSISQFDVNSSLPDLK